MPRRAGEQVVARRHLRDALVERVGRLPADHGGVEQPLAAPARGDPGREQRLHLGGEVERALVPGEEQRLDAEPVAGGEEPLLRLVPEHEGVLAAQLVEAVRAQVLVEVERDLAVGAGAEPVSRPFQLALDPLEVVELAVHDDVAPPVLARDRLVARHQIDDAEPGVAQPDPPVRRDPLPPAIGAAVVQAGGCALERLRGDASVGAIDGYDATHGRWSSKSGPTRYAFGARAAVAGGRGPRSAMDNRSCQSLSDRSG